MYEIKYFIINQKRDENYTVRDAWTVFAKSILVKRGNFNLGLRS